MIFDVDHFWIELDVSVHLGLLLLLHLYHLSHSYLEGVSNALSNCPSVTTLDKCDGTLILLIDQLMCSFQII